MSLHQSAKGKNIFLLLSMFFFYVSEACCLKFILHCRLSETTAIGHC